MNKKDIAEVMCQELETRRYEAYGFIDIMIEAILDCLQTGEKVVLSNFGTFRVIQRQRKRVINPNDKEAMFIAERKIVKFFPARNLKKLVGAKKE